MVCTSKVMAERVAKYGAEKMAPAKYQVKGSGFKNLIGKSYTVINRETGDKYAVSVSVDRPSCSCKFHQENKAFKTCKHILKCQEASADEARYDEIEKAMAEAWGEGGEDQTERGGQSHTCDRQPPQPSPNRYEHFFEVSAIITRQRTEPMKTTNTKTAAPTAPTAPASQSVVTMPR